MNSFEKVNKKLGFGMMRLPTLSNGEIDFTQINNMVDEFMANGFNFFDTAKVYMEGRSEIAVRECIAKRYPRQSFVLADKLSTNCFNSEHEIYDCFQSQLKTCGVDYFDFYFMHAQGSNANKYPKFQRLHAYDIAKELQQQGKIRHIAISFHDSPEYLDKVLNEHPEIELVLIQLNYLDFDDPAVQSRKCLEVCNNHGKRVAVMEPVKGGNLVRLPTAADKILRNLNGGSNASYALRFAASQPGVFMVLSGMSDIFQMRDNISTMKDFSPLTAQENEAIAQVCEVFRNQNLIPCTACRYCVDDCPKRILIPDLFCDLNQQRQYKGWSGGYYYNEVHTVGHGKASDCIKCGKCEAACPQHLNIRELLTQVAATFEK